MSLRLGFVLALATSAFVLARATVPAPHGSRQPIVLTHGVASGDVTTSTAVIWARSSGPTEVHVQYDTNSTFRHPKHGRSAHTSEAADFTAHLTLEHLRPATRYWYRVWLGGARDQRREHLLPGEQDDQEEGDDGHEHGRKRARESVVGTFMTAPEAWQSRPVSFVLGADVGGQRYCRNAAKGGYAIFGKMEALAPDFYIANGDSIYADGDCPAAGPEPGWVNIPGDFPSISDPSVDWTDTEAVREVFLKHWHYNRANPYTQSFFRSTSMISQWDDHEVINDFGAPWTYWNSANIARAGYPNIVAAGLDTFFAYSPIARQPADPTRIYRSFRWGRDVELFVLDARSYRDRNDASDSAETTK